MSYLKGAYNTKVTPQSEAIPGKPMVKNSAGGYTFSLDVFARLQRFLILGSEGGTYYASEQKLSKDNADSVIKAIASDGVRVVKMVEDVSFAGRAPKNSPALFVLALCMSLGDDKTKAAAAMALPKVARTGTHLFEWAGYVDGMRGWGKGLRRAVSNWYLEKNVNTLALHAVKYRQRDGWSHADLLRLAHVQSKEQNLHKADADRNAIFNYMVDGWPEIGAEPHPVDALQIIWAAERAKTADDKELVKLIRDFDLPMEAVPSDKRSKAVYEALATNPRTGVTWVLRNLGNLSRMGVIESGRFNDAYNTVVERLGDRDQLIKGRVHPLQIMVASKTYAQGHGEKGNSTWAVNQRIVEALDEAFYLAFDAVEPTNKRFMLAVDVSGSMGATIAGLSNISARDAAACMTMVSYRKEPKSHIVAFTSTSGWWGSRGKQSDTEGLSDLALSPKDSLKQVISTMSSLQFGGTDCALPMLHAMRRKLEIDTFIVYTDSETWAGTIHPMQALKQYRENMGIPAKLIVVGMTATNFTIADPSDSGSLDVVGFDTAAPTVISEFVQGRV